MHVVRSHVALRPEGERGRLAPSPGGEEPREPGAPTPQRVAGSTASGLVLGVWGRR
jgi:hypothetical protein